MTKEKALENKNRVQTETRRAWLRNFGQGVAELATGVGKSKIGVECIEEIRALFVLTDKGLPRILLVVPTEEMRDIDWPAEFEKWDVSMENVKIVCYATLPKIRLESYDFLIYDECHRLTLPNLQKLEKQLCAPDKPYCLGLTATMPKILDPKDADRVNLLRALFPTVYKITTDEAVELGLIANFEMFVLLFDLNDVHKDIPSGTARKPTFVTEKSKYAELTKKLQTATLQAQKDPRKQGYKFMCTSARAQFLYNLPSKLRLAQLCLKRLEGDCRTIVFAGSIEQANKLCGKNVYHSESSRESLEAFQKGEINVLGAVKALNEGKNLTGIDHAVVVQVDSVDRNLVQRIGRAIRIRYDNLEHKSKIIILVARGTADEKWFNAAIADFDSKRISKTLVRVPELHEI